MSTDPYAPLQGTSNPLMGNTTDPYASPQVNDTTMGEGDNKQKDRIKQIHKEVDETKQIIHENIEHLTERGERLDHLNERTQDLSIQSRHFNQTARKTNRAMWLKNMKWTILICLLIVIILAGIIGGAVKGSQ